MINKLKITAVILLSIIFSASIVSPRAEATTRIETIEAEVMSETSLPPMVKERMEESVAAIGKQLLSGYPLPFTEDWRIQQESTIQVVFDKILVGYTVKSVAIKVLEDKAIIKVTLLPWSDIIKYIKVNVNIEGMPPELGGFILSDLSSVNEVFSDGLSGLPIAAADWTNGILKRRLNKFMQENLPEFRADFDIKIKSNRIRSSSNKSTAMIDLTVYPKLPVVRTISLSMRSDTMPNIALVTHRTFMEDKINVLVGVPVAFIERHKEDIEAMIAKPLDEQTDFVKLKMKSVVNLTISEHLGVMIRSDSSRYRMRATGWVDLGRNSDASDDLLFRMHLGRKISNIDEAFFLVDVAPQEMKWNWALGYSRGILPRTKASLRYDFSDKDFIADLEYSFLKDWLLRYEHKFNDDKKEAAIRYRLHDFLGVEWAVDKRESWLRLIGSF